MATGAVLVNGGSVVIRDNFSASRFWDDVTGWNCTLFQYIGELCRYLLSAPPHPRERAHRIRLCCGNGLRSEIWNAFKERFQIPRILEFYAATEGNVTLFNCEGKPGAIGRIPSFLAHRSRILLVKYDIERGAILRDEMGRAVRCRPGEAGVAIGKMFEMSDNPGARFEGYTNSCDSEAKILRNVLDAGDAWFFTGDLMRSDRDGFFYFVDRAGDTFRWKGENVSTTEVEQAITAFPSVAEANVFGVEFPGVGGRAGMAAPWWVRGSGSPPFDGTLPHFSQLTRTRSSCGLYASLRSPEPSSKRKPIWCGTDMIPARSKMPSISIIQGRKLSFL